MSRYDALRRRQAGDDLRDLVDAILDCLLKHAVRTEHNRGNHSQHDHDDDPFDHFGALFVVHIATDVVQHEKASAGANSFRNWNVGIAVDFTDTPLRIQYTRRSIGNTSDDLCICFPSTPISSDDAPGGPSHPSGSAG